MSVNLDSDITKSSDRDSTPVENVIRGSKSSKRPSNQEPTKQEASSFEQKVEGDGRHVRLSLQQEVVMIPEETYDDDEFHLEDDTVVPQEFKMASMESTQGRTTSQTSKAHSSSLFSIESLMKKPESSNLFENFLQSPVTSIQEKIPFIIGPPSSPTMSTRFSADFLIENRNKSDSFNLSTDEYKGAKGTDIMMFPEENVTIMEEEEPEEEEEEQQEAPPEVPIDRNMYLEMHSIFTQKKQFEKIKNSILQSKMASYYLRRRMFYVLKEPVGRYAESVSKYEQDLEALGELKERSEYQRMVVLDDIDNLKHKHNSKHFELHQLFEKLQQKEQDYGKTLTFEKTGRQNMDKTVERFLKRQRSQKKILKKLRLEYIHLRNRFNEKQQALDALDNLGIGYTIMDYVQLKQDNRNLQDRLEEKEDELVKIQRSCKHTMQVLAHNREKFATIEININTQVEQLEEIAQDIFDAREQLGYLKRQRKLVREETKKLKNENGLLTQPKMLRDMENATNEVEYLKKEIESLEDGYQDAHEKIMAVRKNLERYAHKKEMEKRTSGTILLSDLSVSGGSQRSNKTSPPELTVENLSMKSFPRR